MCACVVCVLCVRGVCACVCACVCARVLCVVCVVLCGVRLCTGKVGTVQPGATHSAYVWCVRGVCGVCVRGVCVVWSVWCVVVCVVHVYALCVMVRVVCTWCVVCVGR
jgi:hypothetical protein